MIAGWSLLLSIMTGVLFLAADAQESEGPIIISPPVNEITLQQGQNYTLLCKHNRPVQFTQQEIAEDVQTEFYMEPKNGTSEDGTEYWVALDLYDVNRFAVGYYACFDDTVNSTGVLREIVEEPNNTAHISYVYIYVNGSDLFTPMRSVVTAKSDAKFLVECKPTAPDINVTLTVPQSNKTPDHVKFYPKIGFIFSEKPLSKIYNCKLRRGKENSSVYIRSHIKSEAPKPVIDGGERYFLDGESFTINCTLSMTKHVYPVDLEWIIPGSDDKVTTVTNLHNITGFNSVLYKNITVRNASRSDAGNYTCEPKTTHDKKSSNSFEKIYLANPVLEVISTTDYKASINGARVRVYKVWLNISRAYPHANVTVLRDNVTLRHDGKKYLMSIGRDSFLLTILNLSADDTGVYTFKFNNGFLERTIDRLLEVKDAPKLNFGPNTIRTFVKGLKASLRCEAVGFPLPEIHWTFTDEDGNTAPLVKNRFVDIENVAKSRSKIVSTLSLPVNVSGNITCSAENEGDHKVNKVEATRRFLVYEIDGGFGIKDIDRMRFGEGESVTLKCLASKYDFVNISWYSEDDEELTNVKVTEGKLSLIAELIMDPISVAQTGVYYCKGIRNSNQYEVANVTVTVEKAQPPNILGLPEETREVDQFERINMTCIADAVPPPIIEWYKDNEPLVFNDEIQNKTKQLNLTSVNSTIEIYPMQMSYAGSYECRAQSLDNTEVKVYNLVVREQPTHKAIYISVAGVIFFILIVLVVYLTWKIKKEKQFRKELAAAGLLYFKEGVTKSINPGLTIDEQAELLPYDDRFEFPPEKLILGKQLGAGAFGVVYKARARGIVNAEEETTVAVKMVKRTADNMYIKALASELKIMVHLGKHINIVNLLGACTKNVGKRELSVIVEYCKFGNIHNYLLKHREVFIDQLNDNTEKNLGKINKGYSSSSANSAMTSDYFGSNHTQATDNTFLNTANSNRSARKDNQKPKESQIKQVDFIKVSESGYVQPEWRTAYESDYSFDGRSPRPLCSRDLLAWSFQIARGMEYLASRKILHGDLAARNILLAEDNIVKICDFGLARSIYKNDEYEKKENSPLPVKWLAIECMSHRIFTTQSDVWSFGIVLWEIFSLAKTPYPNIHPSSLLQYLEDGNRLERPAYADDKLYGVMMHCWEKKPTARPSFNQLQEMLGSYLEDNVRNHYVDLNATYMAMNVKPVGAEDYLAMVSAPDYNNMVVTPSPHQHHYVNDARSFFPPTPTQLQHDDEGYLQMSPASRPTVCNARTQGTKFDFDARMLTPRVSEANSYGSESTPMLTLNNLPRSGSESDQECNASPYMNMCTKIVEETDDDVFGTKENNAKNIQPTSVTNPTYIISLSNDDEKKPQNCTNNYVNVVNNVSNGLVK